MPGLVGFSRALAAAGLGVNVHRTATFLASIEHVDLADPQQLYWTGRVALCAEKDDFPVYDRVFSSWFGANLPAAVPADNDAETRTRDVAALTVVPDEQQEGTENALRASAQDAEVLRHRDLTVLNPADRAHFEMLLRALDARPPQRRSPRFRVCRRGEIDPGRTLRQMLATGGETAQLAHRGKRQRPRTVVLMIDVSGSMSPFADALLRLAHVVTRAAPTTTETFTFGTRLTRVSRALRSRDPELALAAAGNAVPDWAGGTRIGETIRVFCDRWGQRGMARRAVVVLFSDGWECGDPALLDEQMARLSRLAHRVFWVNPYAGRDGYQPVQSGIAAALPHLHTLLAGHSLHAFEQLLNEVRDA
ncbi:VWA domain-containing protein [Nocardia sp. NPDC059239]|uniref:vWA domain-containing protein n=1 Tax=unclassified Nocardia TaxID=2637762 RepID=UPI003686D7BE